MLVIGLVGQHPAGGLLHEGYAAHDDEGGHAHAGCYDGGFAYGDDSGIADDLRTDAEAHEEEDAPDELWHRGEQQREEQQREGSYAGPAHGLLPAAPLVNDQVCRGGA